MFKKLLKFARDHIFLSIMLGLALVSFITVFSLYLSGISVLSLIAVKLSLSLPVLNIPFVANALIQAAVFAVTVSLPGIIWECLKLIPIAVNKIISSFEDDAPKNLVITRVDSQKPQPITPPKQLNHKENNQGLSSKKSSTKKHESKDNNPKELSTNKNNGKKNINPDNTSNKNVANKPTHNTPSPQPFVRLQNAPKKITSNPETITPKEALDNFTEELNKLDNDITFLKKELIGDQIKKDATLISAVKTILVDTSVLSDFLYDAHKDFESEFTAAHQILTEKSMFKFSNVIVIINYLQKNLPTIILSIQICVADVRMRKRIITTLENMTGHFIRLMSNMVVMRTAYFKSSGVTQQEIQNALEAHYKEKEGKWRGDLYPDIYDKRGVIAAKMNQVVESLQAEIAKTDQRFHTTTRSTTPIMTNTTEKPEGLKNQSLSPRSKKNEQSKVSDGVIHCFNEILNSEKVFCTHMSNIYRILITDGWLQKVDGFKGNDATQFLSTHNTDRSKRTEHSLSNLNDAQFVAHNMRHFERLSSNPFEKYFTGNLVNSESFSENIQSLSKAIRIHETDKFNNSEKKEVFELRVESFAVLCARLLKLSMIILPQVVPVMRNQANQLKKSGKVKAASALLKDAQELEHHLIDAANRFTRFELLLRDLQKNHMKCSDETSADGEMINGLLTYVHKKISAVDARLKQLSQKSKGKDTKPPLELWETHIVVSNLS